MAFVLNDGGCISEGKSLLCTYLTLWYCLSEIGSPRQAYVFLHTGVCLSSRSKWWQLPGGRWSQRPGRRTMATQAGDLRRKALSERMGSFISSAVFEAFHVAGQDASMSSPLFIVVTGVCILQFLALPLRLLMSTEPAGEVIGTVLQALAMLRVDELYGSDGLLVTILVVRGLARKRPLSPHPH